jgi:hypothetical protein
MKENISRYEWIIIERSLRMMSETYKFVRGFGEIGIDEKAIQMLIDKVEKINKK